MSVVLLNVSYVDFSLYGFYGSENDASLLEIDENAYSIVMRGGMCEQPEEPEN